MTDPIKTNIVEDPRWSDLMDDEILTRLVDDNMSFIRSNKDACFNMVTDILGDLFDPDVEMGPKEWSPRRPVKIGEDGVQVLCGHVSALPETYALIGDTAQYMFEEAMTPGVQDISWAIDRAADKLTEKHDLDLGLWDPVMDRAAWEDERDILNNILGHTHLKHDVKKYDRFVITDFWKAQAVQALLKTVYADPERLSMKETEVGLKQELAELHEAFMKAFWNELEAIVKDQDIHNRTNWKRWWKETLVDKDRVKGAQDEMTAFLKEKGYAAS